MSQHDPDDLTQLLALASADDPEAREKLYQVVYGQLKKIAHGLINHRNAGDLQTTALVHELFLKFERGQHCKSFVNRKVFFSVASRAMQQILIDHKRKRDQSLDGSHLQKHPLDAVIHSLEERSQTAIDSLTGALKQLEAVAPRQAAVVSYRFFVGLTIEQIAELLGVAAGTVERDWRLARAKLFSKLQ